jgi:type IV pilus assembly protein PilV
MRPLSRLPHSSRNPRHSGGMTLIEVLVTLVIISVGLLGIAALQLTTVRNNYDAFVRAQAAVLASDMLDRMRANRRQAGTYVAAIGAAPATPTGPAGVDIAQWRASLNAQLPNGVGGIAFDAPSAVVTITIEWGERSQVVADRTLRFTTSSQI